MPMALVLGELDAAMAVAQAAERRRRRGSRCRDGGAERRAQCQKTNDYEISHLRVSPFTCMSLHAARSPTGLHGTRAAAIATAPLANDLAAQTRRANSHQKPVSALFFLKRFGLTRGTFFAFRVGRLYSIGRTAARPNTSASGGRLPERESPGAPKSCGAPHKSHCGNMCTSNGPLLGNCQALD